ncbi:hypothetical protein [Paenibacillus harenae]|uniref:Uncharacterized protein n=1 Tax=Paenibacillus harenae TaxID=306543 RepID=A0ABT9U095_PAEHA|nr:hypothetical protein [Paenibacillus harenae]MDQ0112090.1 hypothetical protein [Paenibacillus harenae]
MLGTIWLLSLALCIFVIYLIYRKRQEEENGLFLKLLVYSFIGAFSLGLNGVKLPLGFFIGLFIVARPNKRNRKSKQYAILFGLLLYIWSLAAPAAGQAWYEREQAIEVQADNLYELSFQDMWAAVDAEFHLAGSAKLERFETDYRSDGLIDGMRLEFVDQDNEGFVHYRAELRGKGSKLHVTRIRIEGPWYQYDRALEMFWFAERLDSFNLSALKPSGSDYPTYRLETREGGYVSYGIKDTENYVVDEGGITVLEDDELPVTGFWLNVCGWNAISGQQERYSCAASADFLFDVEYS